MKKLVGHGQPAGASVRYSATTFRELGTSSSRPAVATPNPSHAELLHPEADLRRGQQGIAAPGHRGGAATIGPTLQPDSALWLPAMAVTTFSPLPAS